MMKRIFIINESTKNSIVSDVFTFGCLFLGFTVNHYFLGDSLVLDVVMGMSFFVMVLGVTERKQMTLDEAREYFCGENDGQE